MFFAKISAAQGLPDTPQNRADAARLLREAQRSAAKITDKAARRALLFEILEAQERAEDGNAAGATLAALDGTGPAAFTEEEKLETRLARAHWLAHQNRDAEAKTLLRDLAEHLAPAPQAGAAGAAAEDPNRSRRARRSAVEFLWKKAQPDTALTLAAQVKQIAGKFANASDRREAFRYAVILRAWGGDRAGAKRLALQTLGRQEPAALLLISDRLRHARTPQEAKRWRELLPSAAEQQEWNVLYTESAEIPGQPTVYAAPLFSYLVDALLAAKDWQNAFVFADGVSGAGYRLGAYRAIARAAVKEKTVLQALPKRVEPLIRGLKNAQDRAENYLPFADAYEALGRTPPVLREAEAVPDAASRAWILTHWGEWQARKDPNAARNTLREAETAAAQMLDIGEQIPARVEIVTGFMEAGAKPDAVSLMNKTAQGFSLLPELAESDTLREALANGQAEIGDAAGAAQTAGKIKDGGRRIEALDSLALRFHRAGNRNALPPFLSALPGADARAELLTRLISAQTGAIGPPQKQRYLALATTDSDRISVLLAIAQRQADSKNDAAARVTLNEALPLPAKMPPGLWQTYAQIGAAKLLRRFGENEEARPLLAAAAEQSARALPADKPAEWRVPIAETMIVSRCYAGSDSALELLDIAQAQSEAGDLDAALQTLRHLPAGIARESALRENVSVWMGGPKISRDLSLLIRGTLPEERPYALLTAANILLSEGGVIP